VISGLKSHPLTNLEQIVTGAREGVKLMAEDKQRIESTVCRVPGVSKVVSGVEVIRGGV
jgi:hypothetical protein